MEAHVRPPPADPAKSEFLRVMAWEAHHGRLWAEENPGGGPFSVLCCPASHDGTLSWGGAGADQ
jgi:hypothetical protein